MTTQTFLILAVALAAAPHLAAAAAGTESGTGTGPAPDASRLALAPPRPIELDRRAGEPAFVEARCAAFREANGVLSAIWPDADPAIFAWARAVEPAADLAPLDLVQGYLNGLTGASPAEIAATRLYVSDRATCAPLYGDARHG